jgi:hypothetical protein
MSARFRLIEDDGALRLLEDGSGYRLQEDEVADEVITIEGRCFTESGPEVNVDSARTFQLSVGTVSNLTYDIPETEVSDG